MRLTILFLICSGVLMPILHKNLLSSCIIAQKKPDVFDWQGHRGARGLMPENTIPAFLKALDLGVQTLELDLAVSADNQLILSHEPWLNHDICLKADGSAVKKEEAESLNLHKMTAEDIKKCDCGSRGNPRFSGQIKMFAYKPTLSEMVGAVKKYCEEKKRPLPYFNMEIKSQPEWDEKYTPSVSTFAQLVVDDIKRLQIKEYTCIQSFDPRALEAVKKIDTSVTTAFLVENLKGLKYNLGLLTFKPEIYSPYYKLVYKKTVLSCHKAGMRIIPWTINDPKDMRRMMQLGVDGIITDYPDRILQRVQSKK